MSRRSRRETKAPEEAGAQATSGGADASGGQAVSARAKAGGGAWPSSLAAQLVFLVAVFAVVTGIAELAGAINLGTALGVAQCVFAIAVVWVLLKR